MPTDVFIIAVVLLLGIIAFVFGILHTLWRGICFVVGLVFPRRESTEDENTSGPMVCPRDSCKNVEYRKATFCSQCGTRLVKRRT